MYECEHLGVRVSDTMFAPIDPSTSKDVTSVTVLNRGVQVNLVKFNNTV